MAPTACPAVLAAVLEHLVAVFVLDAVQVVYTLAWLAMRRTGGICFILQLLQGRNAWWHYNAYIGSFILIGRGIGICCVHVYRNASRFWAGAYCYRHVFNNCRCVLVQPWWLQFLAGPLRLVSCSLAIHCNWALAGLGEIACISPPATRAWSSNPLGVVPTCFLLVLAFVCDWAALGGQCHPYRR